MLPNYVQAANVRVDACPEHGTFFDAHELEAVSRAYRRRREAGVPVAATPDIPAIPGDAPDGIWQKIGSLFR
jgi:hypothetical protein